MNNNVLRAASAPIACILSIFLASTAFALPPGSGSLYFVHNDARGTPQALTDEAGDVVWKAQTAPFGATEVDEDPDGDGQAVEFNVRMPGQYYDEETGLHYNYFRYYDPQTGRYITSDPIGLEGGMNTYLYAYANPTRFSDPSGLAPFCPPGQRAVPANNYEDKFPEYFNCSPYSAPERHTTEQECKTICFLPIPPTLLAANKGTEWVAKELAGDLGKHLAGRAFFMYGVYDTAACWKECEEGQCN